MAGPPPPGGRTVAGLTWALRGVLGFLLAAVVTAAGLLAFIQLYGLPAPDVYQIAQLEDALGILSWLVLLIEVAAGLAYAVGLAGIFAGRHDYGPVHARSVEQTVPWVLVTLVLMATVIAVPSVTGPSLTYPGIGFAPPQWALSTGVALAGLRAIFAGLTLFYAVQGIAEEDERVRLLIGMALGVVGATVWSGLSAYAGEVGALSTASLVPYVAGVFAGLGTSVISLAVFALVYRGVRRNLVAGAIPTVFPAPRTAPPGPPPGPSGPAPPRT